METTRQIRTQEAEGTIIGPHYVVAMTACASNSDKEDCYLSGMNGFLSKPIYPGTSLIYIAIIIIININIYLYQQIHCLFN